MAHRIGMFGVLFFVLIYMVGCGSGGSEVDTSGSDEAAVVEEEARDADVVNPSSKEGSYRTVLGVGSDKSRLSDGRVVVVDEGDDVEDSEGDLEVARYSLGIKVLGNIGVIPDETVSGGLKFRDIYEWVRGLAYDWSFASELSGDDFRGVSGEYLVGTEYEGGTASLNSLGVFMSSFGEIDDATSVYFTNLNMYDEISEGVWLCFYDYYSVYGVKREMVVLRGIGGVSRGDIVGVRLFKHNMRIMDVGGYQIVLGVVYDRYAD